jgi:hypothetical protein
MATTSSGPAAPSQAGQSPASGTGRGLPVATIATAGVLMVLAGILHVIQGVVALTSDTFFVVGRDYVFTFDVTRWGWIHLVAGVIVGFAGIALFRAATWARTVAVVVASLSVVTSFMAIPLYPVWSLTVIAFDVLVIWAVTAHGRAIRID